MKKFRGIGVTHLDARELNHYPLSVQVAPSQELRVRVEFDTEVFDGARIEALMERFERVLVAMTADLGQES